MRDNKNLNKLNYIVRIVLMVITILIAIGMTVLLVLSILNHYGIVKGSFTVKNFNWFGVVISCLMIFIFIYFPIKNIKFYIKRLKNKSYNREINTVVISKQTAPINLTDIETEHNKDIKNTSETKQVNTKPSKALIIVLAVIIAMFGLPALLITINNLLPESYKMPDVATGWGYVIFSSLMLLPVIIWQASEIRTYLAIKKNKEIKPIPFSSYLFGLTIMLIFIIAPFVPIWDENKIMDDLVIGIIYWTFVGFLFTLLFFGYLYSIINYNINQRMLNGKISCIKNKAKYIGCKYSNSVSQSINGVPTKTNVKYKVEFSFIDENGIERIKTSTEEYTFKEVAYLKYKQEFAILSHKKRAIIVEDLRNIEIPNNVNIDVEKTNSKTFLPSFARKHRWLLMLILGLVIVTILEAAGIGMIINPKGSDTSGVVCAVLGVVFLGWLLYYCMPSILAEYKGMETYGKLLRLEVDHKRRADHDTNRKYAVVELNGEIKNIYLLYNEWYSLLGEYIGKEIPLKVYRKTAVIDFQKMYSNLI